MIDQLDTSLREVFLEQATHAPALNDQLARTTRRRVRRRRGTLTAGALAMIGAVAAVAVAVSDGDTTSAPVAGPSKPATTTSTSADATHTGSPEPSGALFANSAASCAQGYSLANLRQRAFAFDGTVTRIGKPTTNRAGQPALDLAGVTFSIHHWYRGGNAPYATIDMPTPDSGTSAEGQSPYSVGTRLLVSGEPRWGGAPLHDPIAFGCGFTRYWDRATATAWRNNT